MSANNAPYDQVVATQTYLIVDGENIDATIGNSLFNRRPNPEERPRWDRVRDFAGDAWGLPVKPLFFLNASNGAMPMSFVQALLAMEYRPVPLSGSATDKVVDLGIKAMLAAISERDGDVLLASHDGDFVPEVQTLLEGGHRVGILALREFVSTGLRELEGVEIFDLEHDAHAFTSPLPRVRIIPIEDFDPTQFL